MKAGENIMHHDGRSEDGHESENDVNAPYHKDDGYSSGASTPRGDIPQSQFTLKLSTDSGDESETKPGIHKILSSKAEAWMGKKGITWPWKGNEREQDSKTGGRFSLNWLHNDQEHDSGQQSKVESQPWENVNKNEALFGLEICAKIHNGIIWIVFLSGHFILANLLLHVTLHLRFDKGWIMEQWEKNYYITSLAGASNGSALVVMSKGKEGLRGLRLWTIRSRFNRDEGVRSLSHQQKSSGQPKMAQATKMTK